MTTEIASLSPNVPNISGPLHCALTGKPVTAEEAYWAPPLVTAASLVSIFTRTLLTAPSNLGVILMEDLPDVPYSPDAKMLLARRRSAEQAKLLGVLLVVAAIICTPMFLIAMR